MDMEQRITGLLRQSLEPEELSVINESHLHQGHSGDDGSGESHYRLIIVSKKFEGVSRVQRHRLVIQILGGAIRDIHALSLTLLTPTEKK